MKDTKLNFFKLNFILAVLLSGVFSDKTADLLKDLNSTQNYLSEKCLELANKIKVKTNKKKGPADNRKEELKALC